MPTTSSTLSPPFAHPRHDRQGLRRPDPALLRRLHADPATRVLLLHGDRLAAVEEPGAEEGAIRLRLAWTSPGNLPAPVEARPMSPPPPDAADDPVDVEWVEPQPEPPLWLYLGDHDGFEHLAFVLPPGEESQVALSGIDVRWENLRLLGDSLDDLEQGLAVQAVGLANWHAVSANCPHCGAPTQVRDAGWVRWCPVDDRNIFPRTDPAVIMAVVDDDDRLLLGHATHWPAKRFSTLAGFVEPGESLEEAVRREVMEEVRIPVAEVIYRGSQPWPFPASLMAGFRARVAGRGSAARPDGVEMAGAQWFSRVEILAAIEAGELMLPTRLSISRALIEDWYGGHLPDTEFL